MTGPASRPWGRLASLPWIVGWGLALRVAAALAVEWASRRRGALCLFDDADIYWRLARSIRAGGPFVVEQWGVPHHALRTPGYPLFLAACQGMFGDSTLPARLAQAGLGAVTVWLVARLAGAVWPGEAGRAGWSVPKVAAAWAATDPFIVGMAALLLSEAVFVPLMLAGLWGLAVLWPAERMRPALAAVTGVALGAAVLTRPSWAAFVPALLLVWVAFSARRGEALKGAAIVAFGVVVAMAPWWVRNARVVGRFVPTALWAGASLYDGLRPGATGASDMAFLAEPRFRDLDEPSQDAALSAESLAWARSHPGRVAELAAIKAARFWSPWPNAEGFRSPWLVAVGAVVNVPLYVCLVIGVARCRRDAQALVLLLGPLVGFMLLHMVFVSSIRYRIPAEVPAMGIAAAGLVGRGRMDDGGAGDLRFEI